MIWANFLHIYQPPTQKPYWVKKITAESYRKIFAGLKKFRGAKLTLNASGVLLEQLDKYGEYDVLESMTALLKRGQLELTGTAKYHPILPFLPDGEIIRQIKLNEEICKKYFGNLYKPRGFFPPEMGFTGHIAEIVAKMGYKWIIADELSFPRLERGGNGPDYSKIYHISGIKNFQIYFRERKMSWVILSGQIGTGRLLIDDLRDRLHKKEYLLTAMDGETFGHHRPGLEELLFEIYASPKLKTVLISDLPKYFKEKEVIEPVPSTWALMEKDLERKKPFSRWKDEDNEIHQMQWELTDLALKAVNNASKKAEGFKKARYSLDRALHSDQYWWASARPWWSIEMIERGAKELLDTILTTPGLSKKTKEKAKSLYGSIIFTAFDWQRKGIVDEKAKKEDEEIRQMTDVAMPKLPQKEVEKMIKRLNKEMNLVSRNQEFERASQIRDRIRELKSYIADEER